MAFSDRLNLKLETFSEESLSPIADKHMIVSLSIRTAEQIAYLPKIDYDNVQPIILKAVQEAYQLGLGQTM